MAITDLTGTTWRLNADIITETTWPAHAANYIVNFETENLLDGWDDQGEDIQGTEFVKLSVSNRGSICFVLAIDSDTFEYNMFRATKNTSTGVWTTSYAYTDTFTITGGQDVQNANLISWLELNAIQIVPQSADVVIEYNGSQIASMSDSGTTTLETSGKYCADNITINYTKSGGDDMVFLTATGTTDTTLSLTDTAITTVPLTTVVNSGNASGVLSITDNGIKVLENGYYLVFGSIYYNVDSSATTPIGEGVYIFADSTETHSTIIYQDSNLSSAIGVTPKILQLNANTTVFLKARQRFTANVSKMSVDNDNSATYLCVVKIL